MNIPVIFALDEEKPCRVCGKPTISECCHQCTNTFILLMLETEYAEREKLKRDMNKVPEPSGQE